ncbi:hypothetical protein GCM10010869_13390 [Mesorhizobium tianshanense]|nr:hypothetical protein GCM10010869_13390 [Mesorhizobium tianshanense]
MQKRHFIRLLLNPLPIVAFGGGVKKEQPDAGVVRIKMKVCNTPAGQFYHGHMIWKIYAGQQTFHEFKLLGNGLANAK